jgi:MYXO-CTERM domain-containing protein
MEPNMKNFNTILAVGAVAAVCGAADAALVKIANWNMAGLTGTEATAAGTGSGVTALNATRGAGLTGSSGTNSMNAVGWTGQATDYFSFGFTVGSGDSVNLSSLSIGTRASSTGPGSVGLFYSVNNYSVALATITQGSGAFVNSVIDLSALQGLTGTVEFRLMAIGTNSAAGGTTVSGGTFRMSNFFSGSPLVDQGGFFFTGEVVPAPGALALLGVAGLVGARRRR